MVLSGTIMPQRRRGVIVVTGIIAASAFCSGTVAGPNLMAISDYAAIPAARSPGRDSLSGSEIIYEFDDPDLYFGRVIVRSDEPSSVVRRDLFVGFTGEGLVIDTAWDRQRVRIDELEIWLRISGRILPERSYEWEFDGGGQRSIRGGIPAVIPAMWADGFSIGAEITIVQPEQPEDGRIVRMLYPHGVVNVDAFRRPTGCAWVVLRPKDYGSAFTVRRFSFREMDTKASLERGSSMPIPIRYVPLRSVLEDRVPEVLRRGTEALAGQESEENFWEGRDREATIIITARVVSAMAEAGVERGALMGALRWLALQNDDSNRRFAGAPLGVEAVARRLYCLARHGGMDSFGQAIQSDVERLSAVQAKDGGWTALAVHPDSSDAVKTDSDNDHVFLATMALREAQFAGAHTDKRMWRRAMQYWTDAQAVDGGYRRRRERYGGVGQATTVAYTSTGTAGLIAALDMGVGFGAQRCTGYLASRRQIRVIEDALRWLDAHYRSGLSHVSSFVRPIDPYLEPVRVEWLGSVAGLGRIHDRDRFTETAEFLLRHFDKKTGLFGVRESGDKWAEAPSVSRTADALSALAIGSAPVACRRIVVGDDELHRAEYSGDAQHLVRYLGRRRGRHFAWRRASIDHPLSEWVDAPILLLDVVGPFKWTEQQWSRLRAYCMAGGSVVVDIAADQPSQRDPLLAALRRTFPEFKLTKLESDDPFFKRTTNDHRQASKTNRGGPGVQVIGNGFRHFVYLPRKSWSCWFHTYAVDEHSEVFDFMDRLLSYTTDDVPLRGNLGPSRRLGGPEGSLPSFELRIARMEVGGGGVVYPDLLESADRMSRANYRLGLEPTDQTTSADLLWVSVTGDEALSVDQEKRLRSAISAGVFVFVDVVSGNKDWDEGFRAVLRGMDNGIAVEPMRRSDPVFTGEIRGTQGFDVSTVALRRASHSGNITRGRCDLYRILGQGRSIGVYSAHDLASGIGHHYFPDCRGPTPKYAGRIMLNVLLSAYADKYAPSDEARRN